MIQFKSLKLDLKNLTAACDQFQNLFTYTVSPMIIKCKLIELLELSNTLTAAKQALEPLRYLSEVTEDTI